MSNLQEIFNKVYLGAASQSFERSLAIPEDISISPGFCMYRSQNGLKCNAGHLILDTHYDSRMEGKSFISLMGSREWKTCTGMTLTGEALELVQLLQRAHDRSKSPEEHKERLLRVRDDYGFTTPETP